MTEDIQNGVNGFFFKMGDSQHLQEILQTIVDNPEILNGVKHHIKSIMIPTMEQEAYAYARAYAQIGQARKIE
jgi:glycosyltransferase involved in cell wall biosynthesis